MALKGTIRDFGVADILQLISHQSKTGALLLRNDTDEVRIYFKEGSIVRAEHTEDPAERILGTLMIRANVLSESQLRHALQEQRRTLKRIGAVLVELDYANAETIKEFATLQMTETLYGLFDWHDGTYEFEVAPVEPFLDGVAPIGAETIVMNGMRMVDEWPTLRRKIPSYDLEIERVRQLPPKPYEDRESQDLAAGIGEQERLVYSLCTLGRTVQVIIDRSRLGEFEACHTLAGLISLGYLRIVRPFEEFEEEEAPVTGLPGPGTSIARVMVQATVVALAILAVVESFWFFWGADDQKVEYRVNAIQEHSSKGQMRLLRRAVEVYRLENGGYPDSLEQLVDADIVRQEDTNFPYDRTYFYKVSDGKVVLLPPVY